MVTAECIFHMQFQDMGNRGRRPEVQSKPRTARLSDERDGRNRVGKMSTIFYM